MKKILGLFLVLIVLKCYASNKSFGINPILLNDNEIPIEGGVSVIIAVSMIYGAKSGRYAERREQSKKEI
jgi:hypothetical protein